jgi:hypothetical protein
MGEHRYLLRLLRRPLGSLSGELFLEHALCLHLRHQRFGGRHTSGHTLNQGRLEADERQRLDQKRHAKHFVVLQ